MWTYHVVGTHYVRNPFDYDFGRNHTLRLNTLERLGSLEGRDHFEDGALQFTALNTDALEALGGLPWYWEGVASAHIYDLAWDQGTTTVLHLQIKHRFDPDVTILLSLDGPDLPRFGTYSEMQDFVKWFDPADYADVRATDVDARTIFTEPPAYSLWPVGWTIPDIDALTMGTPDADKLTGTIQADTIAAESGDDLIYARGGSDLIAGGAGDDTIHAGRGDDHIVVSYGSEEIHAGAGNDMVYTLGSYRGRNDWLNDEPDGSLKIFGGAGDDYLEGALRADKIMGGLGSDTINGYDGADRIMGGQGADSLDSGAGNDRIMGLGHDTIDGGIGDDTILAWRGASRIDAGFGDDLIDADAGRDTVTGGFGNDRIILGAGADSFIWTNGHDHLLDFKPDEGDVIDIGSVTGARSGLILFHFDSFDEVLSHAEDHENGVALTLGLGSKLVIDGLSKADLAEDFILF